MNEEKLIQLVRKRRFLYDKMHKSYKNMDLKKRAWAEIGEKMALPVKQVMVRWRSLRDRYQRQKKNDTLKKFRFSDSMSFLGNDSTRDMRESEEFSKCEGFDYDSIDETRFQSVSVVTPYQYSEEFDLKALSEENNTVLDNQKNEGPTSSSSAHSEFVYKNRSIEALLLLKNAQKQMEDVLNIVKSCLGLSNATTAFFNSIAMQVDAANLSQAHFRALQMKILQVVNEELTENTDLLLGS